jgi:2,3-dihydroxybenzoate---[aryl-carrier protein] ligase
MLEGFTPIPPEFAARYRAKGYWLDRPMGQYFREVYDRWGDRIAVVADNTRITYRELGDRVDHLACHLLDLKIAPLDRVVVQLPNRIEFIYLYFALLRVGAIPLLALPPHRKYEIENFVAFADAVAYAGSQRETDYDFVEMARGIKKSAPLLQHLFILGDDVSPDCHSLRGLMNARPKTPVSALDGLKIDPDEPAVFQLSGGTTGIPKIIPRTHNDYILNSVGCSAANDMHEGDCLLVCLPIGHNFPLASPGIQGMFIRGGRVVLAESPRASNIFPLIEKERVTHLELVPAILIRLLHDESIGKYDLSSLRIINTGGQRLQPEVSALAEKLIPSCIVQEVFGMAEGLVTFNRLEDPPQVRYETVGAPWCEDDEIRIVDENLQEVPFGEIGELIVRGPYTLRGYFRAPEVNARSFSADGFYLSGDLMCRHPSGGFIVEGRKKDLINRGGEKISTEEVENMLLGHPAIVNVACVPMPDPILGERTCAYVVPATGARPSLEELTAFLTERGLAKFKLPERLELVDEFPLSAFGKVSKKELVERIKQVVAAEARARR